MMNRLYRLQDDARLYSFDDPVGDVPICGEPLRQAQERCAREAGSEIVDVGDEKDIDEDRYVVFHQGLYFTAPFLRAVRRLVADRATGCRLSLQRNHFNDSVNLPRGGEPEGHWPLDMYFRDRNRPGDDLVTVPQTIHEGDPVGLPGQVAPFIRIDISDCFAAPVPTPFHLLHVNIAVLLSSFATTRRMWPRWLIDRVAPPRSRGFYRALRRRNRIGKRCRIHPTAVLEGVTLGDDVIVGAHAVLRLSRIGSGTTVDDQASVTLSVLGDRNFIANKNHISFSLSYDDVFAIHGPYQFSVFGRACAVFAVIDCDVRLDGRTIRIPTFDGFVDSNQHLLGNAYGHGCKVGGGNIIAPGRIVPNGMRLNPPSLISSFPVTDNE